MSTLGYHYLDPSAPDSSQIIPPLTTNNPGEITSTLGVRRPQSATDVDQFKFIAEQLKAEAQALDQREVQLVEREIAVVKRERAVAAEESKDASTMDRNLRDAFPILTAPAIGNYWPTEKIQAMLVDLIKIGDRVTRNAATHNCARQSGVSTASFTAAFPRTNNNQAQAVAASPAPKIATASSPRLARDARTPSTDIITGLGATNADMAISPTTGEIPILLDLSWRAPPAASMTLEAGRSEDGSNSEESTSEEHSSVDAGDGLEVEQDTHSRASNTEQHRAPCCASTGHDDRVSSSFAFPSSPSRNGTTDDKHPD